MVFQASFCQGKEVTVRFQSDAGEPAAFDGATGSFTVQKLDASAPGFLKQGRLEYTGEFYLKFRDDGYWIRGGTNSPENFLAYAGFDNTPASHTYRKHTKDWKPVFLLLMQRTIGWYC